MRPLTFRTTTLLLVLALMPIMKSSFAAPPPEGCIPVDAKSASGLVKIGIREPGHYCLTENLRARIEMADRPAEIAMIVIQSSDVVLDLRGHYLTHDNKGVGIKIVDATNIRIMNGTLQDFETGINRSTKYPSMKDVEEPPVYDAQTRTYRFARTNIVVENVTFKNNKKDIVIEFKKDLTP